MKQLVPVLTFYFVVLLIGSCVQTPDPDKPKRISYIFNVAHVGDTLSVNQDTVHVNEIKILVDKFNLQMPDSAKLQSSADAIIMNYNQQNNDEDELVLGVNIGFEDFKRFLGLELFIAPPNANDNIQDDEFFGSSGNFSIIMKGKYNNDDFTYKSDANFREVLPFGNPVRLEGGKKTLALRVLLDIEDVLIDETANLIYDPGNSDNKTVIDSLVQTSLEIDAFATERLY